MNIHGPFDFLVLKASDENRSIYNCNDVGAKILKRCSHFLINARHINSNFNQEKQFAGKKCCSLFRC